MFHTVFWKAVPANSNGTSKVCLFLRKIGLELLRCRFYGWGASLFKIRTERTSEPVLDVVVWPFHQPVRISIGCFRMNRVKCAAWCLVDMCDYFCPLSAGVYDRLLYKLLQGVLHGLLSIDMPPGAVAGAPAACMLKVFIGVVKYGK